MTHERWMDEPEEHDYPAAGDYLTLLLDPAAAEAVVAALEKAPLVHRKAKDLLRASGLPLLPADNAHVARDLKKVEDGRKLSPVLLVRGDLARGTPLVVADGYHRICASYHLDENADIPCRLAELP
ncbi:MAG TPA: hypothetical protein VJ456_04645 [Acidimicrobiia bacterium]|nr:hypothetical protein [Acidimicrobiia bacterium]